MCLTSNLSFLGKFDKKWFPPQENCGCLSGGKGMSEEIGFYRPGAVAMPHHLQQAKPMADVIFLRIVMKIYNQISCYI